MAGDGIVLLNYKIFQAVKRLLDNEFSFINQNCLKAMKMKLLRPQLNYQPINQTENLLWKRKDSQSIDFPPLSAFQFCPNL